MPESQQRALKALDRRGRLRTLAPRTGLDFSSNDYLGLAASDALRNAAEAALARGVAVGATGSRLLRGNDPEHEALEHEAAVFFGGETSLFFAGGFTANHTLLATLPARGDLIVADELAHASMLDGMAASKAASITVAHNDANAFSDAITSWRRRGGTGQPWLVVESVFSMDGDLAPLSDLHDIAKRHDALLIIDEAHATGVYGPKGRGLAADLEGQDNVITVHTCGKALGTMGALVVAPELYRDFLVNRARAFIYATAPSPLVAAIVRASLNISADSDGARENLQTLIATVRAALSDRLEITPTATQIQPVIVGQEARAIAVSNAMIDAGFDVRAVRPPTVPEGTSRLRISLTLNVNQGQVTEMVETLSQALQEHAP
ncbi:MAG: 8-amino-7-oxononanoate synthase [Alphaproteobacteria bacterium]|nr:8-amino-7-oxononanoate synthase [Alphaproteobacteria bacterium]